MTMEAIIAVKKESIRKPPTSLDVITRRIAFITKINRPRVIMVVGRVRKIKIGLTNKFNTPKTRATTKAVANESM